MRTNLINDLSKLTLIKERTLLSFKQYILWCISDSVEQSVYKKDDVTEIDIGIGTLKIKHSDNDIKYKFVPSKELEANIATTIIDEKNPLKANIEKSVIDKLTNVYKSFF